MQPRPSGEAFNASGCGPRRACSWKACNLTPDKPNPRPVLGDASAALPAKPNDVRAVVAPGDSPRGGPDRLRAGEGRARSHRANPDRRNAERFARAMTCEALKPQAARLLESLTD